MSPTIVTNQDQRKKIPCLNYTRVCGYPRPVADFNKGKKQEFKDRLTFDKAKNKLEEE